MVPSIFEVTKNACLKPLSHGISVPLLATGPVCRITTIKRPNSKLTAGGGLTIRPSSRKPVSRYQLRFGSMGRNSWITGYPEVTNSEIPTSEFADDPPSDLTPFWRYQCNGDYYVSLQPVCSLQVSN